MILRKKRIISALILLTIITAGCSNAKHDKLTSAKARLEAKENSLLQQIKPFWKEKEVKSQTIKLKFNSIISKIGDDVAKVFMLVDDDIFASNASRPFGEEIVDFTRHLEQAKKNQTSTGHPYFKDGKIIEGLEIELALYKIFRDRTELFLGFIEPDEIK